MVFSNSPPDVKELTKVRFKVFNINNDQLEKKNIVVEEVEREEQAVAELGQAQSQLRLRLWLKNC